MRRNAISRWIGFAGTLVLVSAMAAAQASAASQTKPSHGDQAQDSSSQENCQAAPDRNPSDKDKAGTTKKLDKCGGVLRPPDVGDPDLVKPAPDTGEMPVIKPDQVPDQAPKQK